MKEYTNKDYEKALLHVVNGGDVVLVLEIINSFNAMSPRQQQRIANRFSNKNYAAIRAWSQKQDELDRLAKKEYKPDFRPVLFKARLFQMRLKRFVDSGLQTDELSTEEIDGIHRLAYAKEPALVEQDEADCMAQIGIFDHKLDDYGLNYAQWCIDNNIDPYRHVCQLSE